MFKVSSAHFQVLLPGGAHRPEPDGHHDDHQLERDELDTGDLVTLVTRAVVTRSAVSGGEDTAVKEQGQELQTLNQVEQMSNIPKWKF